MELSLSPVAREKIKRLVDSYPDREACLLPALSIAQQELGCITHEVMELVAQELGLPAERAMSTATFYTMFNKRSVGKFHLQVCRNVSCFLRGGDAIVKTIRDELSIEPGQTTSDGLFTLSTVECLAACGTAPVLQVNDEYHEEMTPEKTRRLLADLKARAAAASKLSTEGR